MFWDAGPPSSVTTFFGFRPHFFGELGCVAAGVVVGIPPSPNSEGAALTFWAFLQLALVFVCLICAGGSTFTDLALVLAVGGIVNGTNEDVGFKRHVNGSMGAKTRRLRVAYFTVSISSSFLCYYGTETCYFLGFPVRPLCKNVPNTRRARST